MSLSAAQVGSQKRRGWTPASLGASLVAWYDASATNGVTSDANGVSQWTDLSGNANHATQATNANKPSFASSRLTFDGSSDRLNVAGVSASTTSRCMAAVIQVASTVTAQGTLFGAQPDSGDLDALIMAVPHSNGDVRIIDGDQADIGVGPSLTRNADIVLLGNVTATTWRITQNGSASSGTHNRTFASGRNVVLGAYSNAGSFIRHFNGSMREVVLASDLSTANQERLEGYLAWQWGLVSSLPAGHPYKNIRP